MKRIKEIDALRGFALFGIIMTHMFQGYLASLVPPQYNGFNMFFPVDELSRFMVRNFFVGKFYAIFSMLFGLSFYLILDGKKDASSRKFAWRLVLLFVIGYVHHIHYRGDFLTVYAVFGIILILFRKIPTKIIFVAGLFLALNGPAVLQKGSALFFQKTEAAPQNTGGKTKLELANSYFDLVLEGEYKKLLISNSTAGFINKYNYLKSSGRMWIVPGLFLLGLWVGRRKWHERLEHIPLKRLILVSFSIGMPLVWINFHFSRSNYSEFVQFLGGISKDASNIFMPLFYIGLLLLAYKSNFIGKFIKYLIPVGKMGLTTYVFQSVFGLFVFYGYGLGLLLKLSGTVALGLGLLFFIMQMLFAQWWFSKFKYGPLEWLWRCGTDRIWLSNKLSESDRVSLKFPVS